MRLTQRKIDRIEKRVNQLLLKNSIPSAYCVIEEFRDTRDPDLASWEIILRVGYTLEDTDFCDHWRFRENIETKSVKEIAFFIANIIICDWDKYPTYGKIDNPSKRDFLTKQDNSITITV